MDTSIFRGGVPAIMTPCLEDRSPNYPALVGRGVLAELPALLQKKVRPSRVHLVSDRNVLKSHGGLIRRQLKRAGIPWSETVLPPGEGSKNMDQLQRILRAAVRYG